MGCMWAMAGCSIVEIPSVIPTSTVAIGLSLIHISEEVLQKRELLGGESDARSIAQRLAEGRTQAARDNAARPAKAAVKESGHDR